MSSPSTLDPERDVDPTQERRVLWAGVVGSVVEWYDFGLFGAASALVIGPLFFSSDLSPAAATLASFATFAIGFFARPVGGLLIANFGDRLGRKPALVFTLFLMGGSTFLMGCLPTYASIGLWAPVLLVLLRLCQGAGAGAELAGVMTIIAETVRPSRRAFGTAVPNGATAVGSALGVVTFLVVSQLPDEQFLSWGWRVPFWFSAVIFVVAVFIRRRIEETPEFLAAQERTERVATTVRVPLFGLLRTHWREVLLGFGAMSGHQAMSYITTTFAISYLTGTLDVGRSVTLAASLTASLVGAVLAAGFGHLADRIGAPRVFLAGAAWCLMMAFPFFLLIDTRAPLLIVLGLVVTYSISFGAMGGAQGAFLVNLFPPEVRYSGVAISRELAGTIVGGPAPLIAAALVAASGGQPWLVAAFLAVVCAVSVVCLLVARARVGDMVVTQPAARGAAR
ncbi:Major Facilitator Superfamily protein [Microlunatus sagamiharensis]|uniref:Major Facilitator Superfamily protein n=1 Tax=Microlunatus sagamiharensis TaxID=546874 RepID=A0A1H2N6D4_9ACTN|nr:MFS transporter [Microlunatus sagamiharensis]SDV00645.1 Major Facilitator Superfamily protein [Microlunatus sagamiharensis]